jgi:enterochelin esterase family protein
MDQAAGAWCGMDGLRFRLSDPDRRLAGVRLVQAIGLPPDRLDFSYDDDERAWRLSLPRNGAWRMEYQLEWRHADGRVERACDPDNPRRVGGAFGDKSVLECPEYVAPAWLGLPAAPGQWRELTMSAPSLSAEIGARVWSPATRTDRVVIVHDGPEYDTFASLGRYTAATIGAGRVAPHHLVLLDPGDRNDWYSANPRYARALSDVVLPRMRAEYGTRRVVGVGTSLGGLALLHAQRRHPRAFAALFLQSGSFFQPHLDRQESGFAHFRRIVRFTDEVVKGGGPEGLGGGKIRAGTGIWAGARNLVGQPRRRGRAAVPTVLTCGLVEENLGNNRTMAAALRAQGYPVELFEVPDAHNFTGWRDALHPYLTDLLRRIWPAS